MSDGGDGAIQVKMLGGFSIQWGDRIVSEEDGRTKKVWMLIEYLLSNRSVDISQEKLIELLWEEDESDAPLNALKNLVYRARKQLGVLTAENNVEFIRYTRGSYGWNNSLPCEVDIEKFEELYDLAKRGTTAEERIDHYMEAIRLYQGEFLPKTAYANWVISKSTYYMSIYNECVRDVGVLLLERARYDDIIRICERAVSIYPFEEDIHRLLLYTYYKTGRINQALKHYEYVSDLFYKEFNISLSDSFQSLYRKLVEGASSVETDLGIIANELKENSGKPGAFYCDYDIFKNIYQLQARSMQRTGYPVYVALITLTDRDGEVPNETILNQVMPQLKDCIVNSLRRGDAVSMYSPAQYVIILPLTTIEGGQVVMRRITTRFAQSHRKANLSVHTRLHAIDPS